MYWQAEETEQIGDCVLCPYGLDNTRGNEAVLRICHVAGFPVDSGRGCGLYHRRRALQLPQGEIYTLGLPSFCYARYGLSYDRRVEDYRNDVSLPRENLKFEPVLPVARKNQNFTSTVIATIYNSPKKMRLDTENYIHGSPTSHDFRQYLAQSIEEGLGGHYWFPIKRADGSINPAAVKRPFFSETINYLKKNGKLFSLFEKKMANHGLLLSKGSRIGEAYLSATAFM